MDSMFFRIVAMALGLLMLPKQALPQALSAQDANKTSNSLNPAAGLMARGQS
jgi:hypothetical protein